MSVRETLELDLSRARSQIQGLDSALQSAAGHFSEGLSRAVGQLQSVSGAPAVTPHVETKEIEQAREQAKGLGLDLKRVGEIAAAIGLAVGAREVLGFFKDSVLAASDLVEATNKVNVVFRQGADSVLAFGKNAATSVGLANDEALDAAASFGSLFLIAGSGEKEAARLSTSMVTLAADLASINNIPIEEALLRLRSGLIGEAEPLRRLNVLISEQAVAAKAAELGLADANGELSEGAKVQARYALIMEQTTRFQGDFARTSDDLANTLRILRAQLKEVQVGAGNEMLPAVLDAATGFRQDLLPALLEASPAIGDIAAAFVNAGGGAIPLLASALRGVTPLLSALGTVLSAIPPDLLAAAESALIFGKVLSVPLAAGFLEMGASAEQAGALGIGFATAIGGILPILAEVDQGLADTVTSIATLGAAGFALGGPYGAAAGALLGFVSSLLGAGESVQEAREEVSSLIKELKGLAPAAAAAKFLDEEIDVLALDFRKTADESERMASRVRGGIEQVGTGVEASVSRAETAFADFRRDLRLTAEESPGAAEKVIAGLRGMGDEAPVTAAQLTALEQAVGKGTEKFKGHAAEAERAADRDRDLADGVDDATAAFDAAADAADRLDEALERSVGVNLSAFEAQRQYNDAVAAAAFGLGVSAGNIDLNTEAGRANADAIASAARSAISYADAVVRQTGDTAAGQAILGQFAQSLLATVPAGSEAEAALRGFLAQLGILPPAAGTAGAATVSGFADPLATGMPGAVQAGGQLAAAAFDQIARLILNGTAATAGYGAGLNLANGIAQGINAGTPFVEAAARRAVDAAKAAADEEARSASPSRLFAESGRDMAAGLAVGFTKEAEALVGAARSVTSRAALATRGGGGFDAATLGRVLTGALAGAGLGQVTVVKVDSMRDALAFVPASVRSDTAFLEG